MLDNAKVFAILPVNVSMKENRRFLSSLKVFFKYEFFDLIRSKRFLLFLIVYISALGLFNLVYWAITEKNMEIYHDPIAGQNSMDSLYRENIVDTFGNTRGILNYVFAIDPVIVLYHYFLLTFAPVFILLYGFPAIAEEVQNKTTKILSLFVNRSVVYCSRFLSILVTIFPVLFIGGFLTYVFNLNRLLPVDEQMQTLFFLKIELFSFLYLTVLVALILAASSFARSSYGALGLGVSFLIFFAFMDSVFPYVSPFSYKKLVFYPGNYIVTYLPPVLISFSTVFYFAGYFAYKRREFK